MDYRTIGGTGVKVSHLCLGAMIFGAWGNRQDVVLDEATLDRIDELVAPGSNVNAGDAGWSSPALEPSARRRA